MNRIREKIFRAVHQESEVDQGKVSLSCDLPYYLIHAAHSGARRIVVPFPVATDIRVRRRHQNDFHLVRGSQRANGLYIPADEVQLPAVGRESILFVQTGLSWNDRSHRMSPGSS